METFDRLSNRGRFARTALLFGVVIFSCLSYFFAVYTFYHNSYSSFVSLFFSRDMLLSFFFITFIWSALESSLKLNEVYRSRPYSYILILHVIENILGVSIFIMLCVLFGLPNYGRSVLMLFGLLSTGLSFMGKVIFYHMLRHYRKKGYNVRKLVVLCDKSSERLLAQIMRHFEWGYKIVAVVGDDYIMRKVGDKLPVYPISGNLENIISQDVDDFIYALDNINSEDVMRLLNVCVDYGINFMLYSTFMNRMSSSTYVRYFDTNAILTISNTPTNYVGLLFKRFIDIVFSGCVILFGFPFFAIIALLIKIDSKGPVFFKQKRSGLKGREFDVYKFRSMVVNAEELKKELMDKNEMDGPVFKMTHDPRITRMGCIIRKTGIDEFPQFINVFKGDMSIVGPRPPLPAEVAEYQRWQMRRLAMKPGITCTWQVSNNRNSISFDEWMKMDMEYIDNWSITLDFVIIMKTISTMLRADGK